jgi:hypothetical protein
MHLSTVLILALTGYAAANRTCGTTQPSLANIEATKNLTQDAGAEPGTQASTYIESITVNTYFHVISAGPSVMEGNIPENMLMNQVTTYLPLFKRALLKIRKLDRISADYHSTGVTFNLVNISHTVNSDWFTFGQGSLEEMEMKRHLRRGGYNDINVYFSNLSDSFLGWCEFPEETPTAEQRVRDGCVVLFSTVPGGSQPQYNLGRTLTHELGHWFGLYHTFQDGCSGGDLVDDTPSQAGPTYGCPSKVHDSCTGPQFPGVDPIHNFMDYVRYPWLKANGSEINCRLRATTRACTNSLLDRALG